MSDMPRRVGRPPLDATDRSVSVGVRMPSKQYDALYQRAQVARVSIPEVIRRDVRRATTRPNGDER